MSADIVGTILVSILLVFGLLMLLVATTTMVWQTYAFSSLDNLKDSYWNTDKKVLTGKPLAFVAIVPAVKEQKEVINATVTSLLKQTYSPQKIIMTIPAWDTDTIAGAMEIVKEHDDSRVMVLPYTGERRNKPSQLQSVYEYLPKPGEPGAPDIVCIFDAETVAAPKLMETVDAAFRSDPYPVAVQGSIQLMNVNDTWISLRCALEYLWWFRSRLHRAAQMGVVPLGGNTVFFRFTYLHQIGGWNTTNLAEDAEIGIRISAIGPKSIVMGYDPEISSQEEAPLDFKTMVKQRTRWNLGFLQTLELGTWKTFDNRRQRFVAFMTLNMPRIQVFTGISLIVSILSVSLVAFTSWSPPFVIAAITMLPGFSAGMVLTLDVVALRHLGQEYKIPIRLWTYIRLIVTTPLYQISLSAAAIRAEWKFYRKDFAWFKTSHVGRHLETEAPIIPAPVTVSTRPASTPVVEPIHTTAPQGVSSRA